MNWSSLFRPAVDRFADAFANGHVHMPLNRIPSTGLRDRGALSTTRGERDEQPVRRGGQANPPIAEDIRRRQLALLVRYVAITRVR